MHRRVILTRTLRTTALLFSSLPLLLLAGCGKSTPTMAPVKGKVTLNGQPLTSGTVITIPEAGRGARGVIGADGSFELQTFEKKIDGAIIGTHRVGVVALMVGGKGPEGGYGKSLIPNRYSNPESSGLTIDVKAGETNAPALELTSP